MALETGYYLLYTGGILNLMFAIFHVFFWRLFRWKSELNKLTSLNSSVMQILNLCLIFVFICFAVGSVFWTKEMLTTSLGTFILISIGLFWFLRAIEQILFFGLTKGLSVTLFILFVAGSLLYLLPAAYFNNF